MSNTGAGRLILGTGGGDRLVTPAGDATNGFLILGLGGDDTLGGGPRSDTIDGGSGADGITGDRWQPGPGLWPSRGDNLIRGGSGNDSITAGFGDDTVDGGSGDDVIRGYGGDGISPGQTIGFWEQDGSDVLDGGSGNDTITAYGGADLLRGGSGDDVLTGGIGVDTLVGGPGADTFRFGFLAPVQSRYRGDAGMGEGQRDIIEDFRSGQDHIDLTGPLGYIHGIQNLRITDAGDGLLVSFDAVTPGRLVPQEIEVFGARALADGDIIIA
jgi:Ca2+-binding RTX toxin-like protein